MPKLTLLDMVQDILSDMNSSPVNSVSDTTEALQVAQIIKTTFFEIVNSRLWPSHSKITPITTAADSENPTKFVVSETFMKLNWLKYNTSKVVGETEYKDLTYLKPKEFLDIVSERNSSDETIKTVSINTSVNLLIKNDVMPTYWTSFDGESGYLDSYDSTVDSTIQQSKLIGEAIIEPSFTIADSFKPDLPSKAFPYLLAESKSTCFEKIKQAPSQKEEQRSRRQRTWLAREKRVVEQGVKYVSWGRK